MNVDNTQTIPVTALGGRLGFLEEDQEEELADAVIAAFDLQIR